jgi:hypothetical protein
MIKGLVIPFLLVLVVAVSCSTSNKKTFDLNDYRIAYNVYYDTANGNYEIFSMKADGSDKKNISNSPGIDWVYYAYKDKIILPLIGIQPIACIFCMRWMQREIMCEKLLISVWKIHTWGAEIKVRSWWFQEE